jgi:RHS repeat-associated protein
LSFTYDALNRLTKDISTGQFTNQYTYTSYGRLKTENGPWASDVLTIVLNSDRQRTNISMTQPSGTLNESFTYDAARRLQSVVSPAGTFTYQYHTGLASIGTPASLIQKISLPNNAYITNLFDTVARLTSTALKTSSDATLNSHAYTYNTGNERTNQTRTDGSFVNYTYDHLGQLIQAQGKESGGTTNRLHERFGYGYDAAGNLTKRTNDAFVQTFTPDPLNRLSSVSRSGNLTVAGYTIGAATTVTVNSAAATLYSDNTFAATNLAIGSTYTAVAFDGFGRGDTNTITVSLPSPVTYTSDSNGNLTSDGRRSFTYDNENQLTSVNVATAWKVDFLYDGRMRRRIRKDFNFQGGAFVQTNEVHYIYDGMLVIQERDSNNNPLVTYTRGNDLSSSIEGAGGIGGLVARTDNTASTHAYYHADGNGNVTAMANNQQVIVAKYLFDSFGNTLAQSGTLADANVYRFSSKEYHPNSGLYYYGYRFYDSNLQRWLNRDPIGEDGGINLYAFVANNPVIWVDRWGLVIVGQPVKVDPNANTILCHGGKLTVQNRDKGIGRKCTGEHEYRHLLDWKERYGDDLCKGVKDGYLPVGGDDYEEFKRKSECRASKAGKNCLEDLLRKCKPKNRAAVQVELDWEKELLRRHKCD